jgi:cytochrome P450
MNGGMGAGSVDVVAVRRAPQVRGYPVVGVVPKLFRDPVAFCADVVRTHGDFVGLDLGFSQGYIVCNPSHVKEVLQEKNRNFGKGKSWEAMRHVIGNSLATADGEYWLRQRRMIQPAFHRERLARIASLLVQTIERRLDRWQENAKSGTPVDVARELKQLSIDGFLQAMFGTSLTPEEADGLDVALRDVAEGIGTALVASFLPKFVPIPGKKKFRRAVETLDRVVFRVLRDRRSSGASVDDLLGMLLDAHDEATGQGMDDQQLRDELLGLFIAAYETTSLSVGWTFYALTQHPEIEKRLASEMARALGDRSVRFEDLRELEYARMVFEEAMRRYPPGWVLPRQAEADDEVGGYFVRAKSFVLVCNFLTHMHPEYWDEPDRFDPERFAAERTVQRSKYAFYPFGAGPHQCVGNSFATMQAQFILASAFRRYRFELAAPVRAKAVHVTLRPDPGLSMRIASR